MKTIRPQTLVATVLVCATALLNLSLFTMAHAQSAAPAKENTVGRSLGIASLPNLRDVGGYMTRDGLIMLIQK
jgi:hypothetical protein